MANHPLGAARPPVLGLTAIAAAAALWAVAATAAAELFATGVAPLELVQARAVIATVGFALVPAAWRARSGPSQLRLVISMGVAIALVNAAYYIAIDHLDVAVAIVLQYTAPAMVVAWSALVSRRPVPSRIVIACVAAFAGVALASELPTEGLGRVDRIGLLAGAASAVLFSAYTVISENVSRTYGSAGALLRAFAVATLLWVLYQAPQGLPHALFDPENLPRVLFVGVAGTLMPFFLFIWGVQQVRAERGAIAATLEPVLAAVVAWLWLGQELSAIQIAGGLLVIGAVASLQMSPEAHAPVAVEPVAIERA